MSFPVNAAVPCGLILNELACNALKHAFGGRNGGEVAVSLRADSHGRVRLGVRDNGSGLPTGSDWKQARSLGLRLVRMLSGQLGGTVEAGPGTQFHLQFTIKEAKSAADVSGAAGQMKAIESNHFEPTTI